MEQEVYKNIVFDVGEVLLTYDWCGALEKAGLTHEEACRIGPLLFKDPTWKETDRAVLPYFDVVRELASHYPGFEEQIIEFMTRAERMPLPREKVWKLVAELKKAGYRLYICSNYSEYLFTAHTKDRPFMKYMDGVMVSYMVKQIKPDKDIFLSLFERFGLEPSECLFLDDKEENILGAKAAGMDGVVITSEEFLIEKLKELLQ